MQSSDLSFKSKKDTRRRALTSLPLPVLDEENSCLGMELEEAESYHDLPTLPNDLFQSPHPSLKNRSRLNTTCATANCNPFSATEASFKQREDFHDELFFSTTLKRTRDILIVLPLERHDITYKLRGKMMDWMIEVLGIYKQREETLFRTFQLLDNYLIKSSQSLMADELHLIGASCMLIASKAEEVRPISLTVMSQEICKSKFAKKAIMDKELEVLSTVGFSTSTPTVFEVIRCALRLLDIDEGEVGGFIKNVSVLIAKMCLFSVPLLARCKLNEIAAAAVCLSLKLVENLQQDFASDAHITKMAQQFELDKSEFMPLLRDIHCFLTSFDKELPFVRNLKFM